MTKEEYYNYLSDVDFISKEMQFYSYEDFMNNAEWIKRLYQKLNRNGKKMYMWYVFSKRYISFNKVSQIWDILNGIVDCPECDLQYEIFSIFDE